MTDIATQSIPTPVSRILFTRIVASLRPRRATVRTATDTGSVRSCSEVFSDALATLPLL